MIAPPFEKTYLSRAQSRAWSMDNPVGDPFGGPAYGQKEEPVSMIAAVVAIGTGATAVATATTTLAMVMGGLMIAGGAAAAIGTVSGNKKLAMIGGIVAGVGGLGLGAANLLADTAATTATTAIDAGATSAEQVGAQGFNAYTPAEVEAMKSVGEQAVAEMAAVPTAADATAASFQAPSAAFNPTAIGGNSNIAADVGGSGLINNALDTSSAGEVAKVAPDTFMASESAEILGGSPGKDMLSADMSPYVNDPNYLEALNGTSTINPANASGADITKYASDPNYIEALNGTPVTNTTSTSGVDLSKYANDSNYIEALTGQQPSAQTSWLDKVEGIAKGIEKYKTTAMLGGNLISGAMRYAIPSQTDQAAIDLYNAKANLANQEAAAIAALEERKRRQNEAVKNMAPVQLNNPTNPIFGNALSGAGIINSARA